MGGRRAAVLLLVRWVGFRGGVFVWRRGGRPGPVFVRVCTCGCVIIIYVCVCVCVCAITNNT